MRGANAGERSELDDVAGRSGLAEGGGEGAGLDPGVAVAAADNRSDACERPAGDESEPCSCIPQIAADKRRRLIVRLIKCL